MRDGDAVKLVIAAGAIGLLLDATRHKLTPFDSLFDRAGDQYTIDPDMLRAIAKRESEFNPKAVSPPNRNGTRDWGLMQINEVTARHYSVTTDQLFAPDVAIDTAGKYLADIRRELGTKWNPYTWVSAYNAGSPSVLRFGITNPAYVGAVMYHWQMFKAARAFA